jgi:putative FmdB family regulatory protein
MPTYSYRCTECETAFDIHQAFTDDSLTVCPKCGGKLRKLFSAVGVSFSGSGFYRNDSRASETKAREKKEGSKQDAVPAAASKETAATPASSGSASAAAAASSGSASAAAASGSAAPAASTPAPAKAAAAKE